LDEADKTLSAAGDYAALVKVHRGHLDLAFARREARQGNTVRATELRNSAKQRLIETTSQALMVDDIATAHRWLESAFRLDASDGYPAHAWIIASDGSWFRAPRGWRVGIESRAKARLVLCALVRARAKALTIDEVFEAGWPGEKMLRRAAEARVYNIIKMLRAAGLRDLILSNENGYFLDPNQTVVTV
jgi:hypothetical protein